MAIVKKSELKQMNEKSLKEKMNEIKRELIKINAQIAVGTIPEKPGRIKDMKKTHNLKKFQKLIHIRASVHFWFLSSC